MRLGRGDITIHLIDGTYELFRSYFAMPKLQAPDGRPVGAIRGFIQTILGLIRDYEVTHVACAFDHEIESFRNTILDEYKNGDNVPVDLMSQFDLAEQAAKAMGIIVWPMIEFEADDALATAVERWSRDRRVNRLVICSPDKDLCQLVVGDKVVCLDRRKNEIIDENGVKKKFGVMPTSIPDFLALVGDTADGIPGVPRWGAKSAATVLSQFVHIEDIPDSPTEWNPRPRSAGRLAQELINARDQVAIYKNIATLRKDVPISQTLDELEWNGVNKSEYIGLCRELGMKRLASAPLRWRR